MWDITWIDLIRIEWTDVFVGRSCGANIFSNILYYLKYNISTDNGDKRFVTKIHTITGFDWGNHQWSGESFGWCFDRTVFLEGRIGSGCSVRHKICDRKSGRLRQLAQIHWKFWRILWTVDSSIGRIVFFEVQLLSIFLIFFTRKNVRD